MQRSTNYTFYLPDNSDYRDVSVFNWNFNKIDSELAKTNSDIAIFASGNNAPQAITSGQYVIWGGNLYTASTNIASGTTLSTDNLTRVSVGGLNSALSAANNNVQYIKGRYEMGEALASTADVSTALNSVIANMALFEVRNGQFKYEGTSDIFKNGYRYLVQINKGASNDFCSAIFTVAGALEFVYASKNGNGWTYRSLGNEVSIYHKIIADFTSVASRSYTMASGTRIFVVSLAGSGPNLFAFVACCTSTGAIGRLDLGKGNGTTITSSTANTITIEQSTPTSLPLLVFSNAKAGVDGFVKNS